MQEIVRSAVEMLATIAAISPRCASHSRNDQPVPKAEKCIVSQDHTFLHLQLQSLTIELVNLATDVRPLLVSMELEDGVYAAGS